MGNPKAFFLVLDNRLGKQASQPNRHQRLVRELFDHPLLNCANFYWRLSHGPRSANAIESSTRPVHYKPEQYLCA